MEDSILSKLELFRLGDETSDWQWDDVTKLVRLHRGALDLGHLRSMADAIGVRDLLERLLASGPS